MTGVADPGPAAGPAARVPPLAPNRRGPLARLAGAVAARATGGEPPRVITTLARHRRLFRRWLPFGAGLLRGDLPGPDRECIVDRHDRRAIRPMHPPRATRTGTSRPWPTPRRATPGPT